MNKIENKLVPELRFPEFINDEEWEQDKFENLITIITPPKKLNSSKYLAEGKFPIIDQSQKYYCGRTNDENAVISNGLPLIIFGDHTCIVKIATEPFAQGADGIKIIKTKDKINSIFLSQYLQYNPVKQEEYKRHFSILKNKIVHFPNKRTNEQQKIADCLSSLDDVISSHNNKLENLKNHKKGLLQSLFPQEREAVPKFRFPEYRNKEDWKEKTIEQIAKVTTGNRDTQNKIDNGTYPFFVRSQTVERINSFSYDGEAILTSGDGVGVGKNFHYINGRFDFHQRVYCIYDFNEEVFGQFIFMYFSQHFYDRVMKMNAKNSVDSVRMAMITEMPISLPSKDEQQKIAECLLEIDNLITAQTNKIGQLKEHKKGLMQRLFPQIT